MANLQEKLDALHARVRNIPVLQRFTVFTRLLLGVGFIAPGLTKVLGNRFTTISTDDPIGYFFEAMYQTGFYWRFIGLAQIIAAILTLIPRTTTWGAICFFPIILNIFVITVSLNFTGTPFITGLMLLANLYLLCWDYHKFKAVLFRHPTPPPAFVEITPHWVERVGYGLVMVTSMAILFVIRGMLPLPATLRLSLLLTGFLGGLMILTGWFLLFRRSH